jgi:Zinc carboxypeptidase/Chitobiase/beta-hexosaminidase C-terminal domain
MRPWMGALAATAAIAMLPAASALAADGDPSVIEVKLPNKAAAQHLIDIGFDLGDGLDQSNPNSVKATVVVTPEEQAQLTAMGYPTVNTIQTPADVDALRAERQKTIDAENAAKEALNNAPSSGKTKKAAVGTVRAQHADYWEDAGGRWLSVEGTTTQATVTPPRTYSGPQLVASWYDASGNQIGSANLQPYLDTDVSPVAPYLYHVSRYRLGDASTIGTPMPAFVRIAAPNGDVAQLDVRKWVGNGAPQYAAGFQQDFMTHYVDPQESYKLMSDLAAQYPNISQVYDLPNKTPGYQRHSQAILGLKTPYTNATGNLDQVPPSAPRGQPPVTPNPGESTAERQAQAVVLTSNAWGQDGGNNVRVRLVNPGASGEPLLVAVDPATSMIRVNLATDDNGAITSTAKQVVDAINANAEAAKLVTASTYRGNTGAGVVAPGASATTLSDFLNAPLSYPRGPQTVKMLRIGKHRDGTKVGVFIYCQEHAREWGTPLVCDETAQRLLKNYGTDAETTNLVDNLDIFIIPTINADGAAYSMYDNAAQRRNMVDYCASNPAGANDPMARNSWGVDLNRNFSVGSFFDGFQGASGNCTSDTFAGPSELSEPEVRNEAYVQSTFSNIKFAMNVHSNGGYFMWPPGAYKPTTREPLPYPPYGTLNYFDQTAKAVNDRIYNYRHTAILPQQTGPVLDVLYSAAGNSADEAYYNHGIIGYDFEIGASHVLPDGSSVNTGFQPCFGGVGTGGGFGNCPSSGSLVNEGHDEGMEFANGNYALLASALAYQNDTAPPTVTASGDSVTNVAQAVKFTSNEASSIYYTLDGSTPTTSSTEWKPNRPRELPDPVQINDDATLKWIAVDFKGNQSAVQSKSFVIDTVAPTISLTGFNEGDTFTQGRPIKVSYTCADEQGGSGVASCTGTTANGGNLDTSTPGTFAYTVTAKDAGGNTTTVTRSYSVIPATNSNGGVSGTVPATLSLTLNAPAQFGNFTPGVTRTYTASTTANVISTAGDALLSVADPDANAASVGHLVNGTFVLPQPLQARARNATNTGTAFNNVGSSASPLNLLTWSAPISNDALTLEFSQLVNQNDPLRTGTYSKALTFTLSTTTP